MKALFNCHVPFSLAHGGAQIQIEQTRLGLERLGVTVEPLRWWDDRQEGEILHHFGRIPTGLLRLAHDRGMKVVMTDLLTSVGSRSMPRVRLLKVMIRMVERTVPAGMRIPFNWDSYRLADACVVNTEHESYLVRYLYGTCPSRVHVVPNGVEEIFFSSPRASRGKWLVCTATITPRKRVLELARAAVAAQTPLWVIGKPYGAGDDYSARFAALAQAHPDLLHYRGPINDRAELAGIYRSARGFVLLSTMETRSLSSEEAAACECPLLLSDLPWARDVFKEQAVYCPVDVEAAKTARVLREFYDRAPQCPVPRKPLSWLDVAQDYERVYRQVLSGKRP
jgi:glycosyltransferase involved in cell wall biosynthesis